MPSNFWWLFAAYSVVWLVLFAYVAKLLAKQAELEKSVRRLEAERSRPTT